MKNDIKNEVQLEAIENWVSSGCKGTISMVTGGGKTRIGVLISYLYSQGNVLIVTPTQNLRDIQWKDEFIKWLGMIPPNVTIECINTSYKKNQEHYDLIIVDEIHLSFGEKFGLIYNKSYNKILGLTATPPSKEELLNKLNEVAPICYELNIHKALELGIVSKFKMFNLAVNFSQKERAKYKVFDTLFNKNKYELSKWLYSSDTKEYSNIFDLASVARQNKEHPMHNISKSFFFAIQRRKQVCYSAHNKYVATIQLLNEILVDNKVIIFSKQTKFADYIYESLPHRTIRYHSKMTQDAREKALGRFDTEKNINVIASADALKQGFNIPSLDSAICASGDSVDISMIQQLGRIIRYQDDKISIFVNLYVPKTQDEVWVQKKTENLDPIWVKSINDIKKCLNIPIT